jgi:hypothetical protein
MADKEIKMNEWLPASAGPLTEDGKVKSKLGKLAYRPGWHLNETAPYVNHIGRKGENGKVSYLKEDHVWCEVEYRTDVDYQNVVNENGRNKQGKIISGKAYMKEIPINGFYRYKTNANQVEPWIICGEMKVNRILPDREVRWRCQQVGLDALPRYGGAFDTKKYGIAM